jgi:ABC-2 type transport system ATP-binding protein
MPVVISVRDIRKAYGSVRAIDGVSFEVQAGEILGLVGPNGAGKTTTLECIEGLRRADSGTIQVLGLDPWTAGPGLKQRIGVQLQSSALPPRLKVGEALDLYASFYRQSIPALPLLERLGIADKRHTAFAKLSGGQKQRLFIALALLNDPELVFLDELTTGLDPQARHAMWDLVVDIRARGKTVLLTTHFMEEAERLCDRVAIVDHGRIVALDAPSALIRSLGAEKRLIFPLPYGTEPPSLTHLPQVKRVERRGDLLVVYGLGDRFVSTVVAAAEQAGLPLAELRTEQTTLEDVFLTLTGRELRE